MNFEWGPRVWSHGGFDLGLPLASTSGELSDRSIDGLGRNPIKPRPYSALDGSGIMAHSSEKNAKSFYTKKLFGGFRLRVAKPRRKACKNPIKFKL